MPLGNSLGQNAYSLVIDSFERWTAGSLCRTARHFVLRSRTSAAEFDNIATNISGTRGLAAQAPSNDTHLLNRSRRQWPSLPAFDVTGMTVVYLMPRIVRWQRCSASC